MKKRRQQRNIRRISRRYWHWSLFWLTLAVAAIACSHRLVPTSPEAPRKTGSGQLELPSTRATDTLIYNAEGRYTLLYRPHAKVPQWVAYKLTSSDLTGASDRSNAFAPDPRLSRYGWPSATHSDYRGSGYDRGHLLPSADRTDSEASNRSTFLYSNMAPQHPRLNRGAWKVLEEHLRRSTSGYDTLYIVVGTVLATPDPQTIGDRVAVPALFFKAIAFRRGDIFESKAYVMPNDESRLSGRTFSDFEVSVDSVERLSGLDLFPLIPGI